MISSAELVKVAEWFKQNSDAIRDEVIKAGNESKSAESFDIPGLYGSLPGILMIDSRIDGPCFKDYDDIDFAPFAMVCKIIELYRAQVK